VTAGTGYPVGVTVNEPLTPAEKVAAFAEVMAGAACLGLVVAVMLTPVAYSGPAL
jgi:hypothetical protein